MMIGYLIAIDRSQLKLNILENYQDKLRSIQQV